MLDKKLVKKGDEVGILAFAVEQVRRFMKDRKNLTDFRYFPLDFQAWKFGFDETMKVLEFMYTGRIVVEDELFDRFERLVKSMIDQKMDPIDKDENSIIERQENNQ